MNHVEARQRNGPLRLKLPSNVVTHDRGDHSFFVDPLTTELSNYFISNGLNTRQRSR